MISNDVRFHPLSKKITLFVGSILLTNIVASHKCYVCRPTNLGNADSIPSCDQFEPTNLNFIRECPSSSKGCSIITNGTVLTRTCEKIAFNQCQVANNVEYCFCTTDLCNVMNEKLPKKQTTTPTDEADDDSDEDGSGTHSIEVTSPLDITRVLTPGTPKTPQHNETTNNSSMSTLNTHQINSLLIFCIMMVYRYGYRGNAWFLSYM